MAGYEYQRFQTGAQPFWTPLGFPGQYHDAETDLFQNWNRFYDGSTGKYLQADPLANNPTAILEWMRAANLQLPAYAYAQNNPLGFTDETGKIPGWRETITGILIGLKMLHPIFEDPTLVPPETPEEPLETPGPGRPSSPKGGKPPPPPGGPGGGGGGDPPPVPPGGGNMCPAFMLRPPPDPCSPLNKIFYPADSRECIR